MVFELHRRVALRVAGHGSGVVGKVLGALAGLDESGRHLIFTDDCARESRCDPFANLKVTPLQVTFAKV